MHQGNLFIDPQGRLVAVDFGITGRLGPKERRFLAEILYGFITRNYRRVAEVHFEAGYVPETFSIDDFAQAVRAIFAYSFLRRRYACAVDKANQFAHGYSLGDHGLTIGFTADIAFDIGSANVLGDCFAFVGLHVGNHYPAAARG
jgi:hypothetical protein